MFFRLKLLVGRALCTGSFTGGRADKQLNVLVLRNSRFQQSPFLGYFKKFRKQKLKGEDFSENYYTLYFSNAFSDEILWYRIIYLSVDARKPLYGVALSLVAREGVKSKPPQERGQRGKALPHYFPIRDGRISLLCKTNTSLGAVSNTKNPVT